MARTSNDLDVCEYWTPAQCRQRLGRSAQFWRRLFDDGRIAGHTTEGGHRWIRAESARTYIANCYAAAAALHENPGEVLHVPINPPTNFAAAFGDLLERFDCAS